ncbi:MAG TPA: hypothetical protein VMG38_08915 [Trebonia sp.]|nr:hypothetical protein [Trebonia sp.]
MSHARVHPEDAAGGHAAGATGAGSVVLELGGDTGALVLHVPARLHGAEIEISPQGGSRPGHRTHALVRERVTASGTSYAALYPDVPAGRYTIWGDDGAPAGTTVISGGQVASFHWPG